MGDSEMERVGDVHMKQGKRVGDKDDGKPTI